MKVFRVLVLSAIVAGCSVETSAIVSDAGADGPDADAVDSRVTTDSRPPADSEADTGAPGDVGPADTAGDSAPLPGDWWDPAYTRRARLRFDNSSNANDLNLFPVLVVLTPERYDYGAASTDGRDLRFLDDDHTTVIPHETERFVIGGRSFVWAAVPTIDRMSNSDHIWLYYGNADATDAQDRTGTWSGAYHAVYHLDGDDLSDATGRHGALSAFGDSAQVDGVAGGARRFDGVDDYLDTGCTHQLDRYTVTAWSRARRPPQTTFISGPLMKEESYQLTWDHTDEYFRGGASLNASDWRATPFSTFPAETWTLLGASYDESRLRAWQDGNIASANDDISGPPDTTSNPARIARHSWRPDSEEPYFAGDVDEVRIQTVARSQGWMRAQHLSMTDSFVTFE